jgi:hypothetical protein
MRKIFYFGFFFLCCFNAYKTFAQRVPVLDQIKLPHNYYFRELYLPQLTSGPSSVSWMPDGKSLVYSKAGGLWKHNLESRLEEQLTDGDGYDYQPDVSPDGKKIIFVWYNGSSVQLMLLDLINGKTINLRTDNEVYLEPRWSPDGNQIAFVSTLQSGHFLLFVADFKNDQIGQIKCLTPDQKSVVKRYYYSPYDHAINPTWSRDGKEIFFVYNHEIAHGTGDLVRMNIQSGEIRTVQHEETNWKTKPDLSPDGTRLVYSSYLGRNWHQLWMLPVNGGYAVPITYGEYDNTSPRWSPDGKQIAFVSNKEGNTSLWTLNVFDGSQHKIVAQETRYLQPRAKLTIIIRDELGKIIPARVSVTDVRGKFYAPQDAIIHGDDSRFLPTENFESHYFHSNGTSQIELPNDKFSIQINHGPEYEILKMEGVTVPQTLEITLKRILLPGTEKLYSGDLHVHMNYGGTYHNTINDLQPQAEAEALDFVFNLTVNKEQRIPDIFSFTTKQDLLQQKAVILNGQEFHTSFWGHLGLLNLNDHFILPDYSGYPQTAVESLFPHNGFVADRAHEQKGLVGYVHPFEQSEIFPDQSETLFNELPVDAALRKVDYYELIGFAEHKASEAVWYQLLNCGFHIPAGAGTDAMANYASLRGPLGLNRVYVNSREKINYNEFLKKVKEGKSFVTNGPLVGFTVEGKNAGDSISLTKKEQSLNYKIFVRSHVPVDHAEVVFNGEVIATHSLTGDKKTLDLNGLVKLKGSGWLLFRVWSEAAHPDLPDMYPFASTNPIYIKGQFSNPKQKEAASFFLKWVNRIEKKVPSLYFRNEEERNTVLNEVRKSSFFYESLLGNRKK